MGDTPNDISKPNYDLLMERLQKQDEVINALRKQNDDIIAFNRKLLNVSEPDSPKVNASKRHEEMEKLLKEAINNG